MFAATRDKCRRLRPALILIRRPSLSAMLLIGEDSSVWPCAVIRGDVHYIRIGARTNVQDGSMLHVMRETNRWCWAMTSRWATALLARLHD